MPPPPPESRRKRFKPNVACVVEESTAADMGISRAPRGRGDRGRGRGRGFVARQPNVFYDDTDERPAPVQTAASSVMGSVSPPPPSDPSRPNSPPAASTAGGIPSIAAISEVGPNPPVVLPDPQEPPFVPPPPASTAVEAASVESAARLASNKAAFQSSSSATGGIPNDTVVLVQLPSAWPLVARPGEARDTAAGAASDILGTSASAAPRGFGSATGRVGTLRVHRSGRAILYVGGVAYEVTATPRPSYAASVVSVDGLESAAQSDSVPCEADAADGEAADAIKPSGLGAAAPWGGEVRTRSGRMYALGDVERRYVVSPIGPEPSK